MKKIKHSNKVLSADNQQERLKTINPWYIVGFVEGEGTFHVAFYKDPRMKQGIKVIPEFHINQSYLRLEILEAIKNYFGCGYLKQNHIKNKKDDTYVLVVRNRDDLLNKVIPFFEKYNFISDKQKSFLIFKGIVLQMEKGEHSTKTGIKKIIDLAYKMNVNGKYRKTKKQDLWL
jgi:hypothetical protein